jgi:hypothetical protein
MSYNLCYVCFSERREGKPEALTWDFLFIKKEEIKGFEL